jgi:hypothetical protein
MAKATEFEDSHSVKAEGISIVKGLTEVGQQLFPLREKAKSGKKLSKRDQTKLDKLEREYRALEANVFELMRPKEPSPWLRGVDHTHSKVGPKGDHAH